MSKKQYIVEFWTKSVVYEKGGVLVDAETPEEAKELADFREADYEETDRGTLEHGIDKVIEARVYTLEYLMLQNLAHQRVVSKIDDRDEEPEVSEEFAKAIGGRVRASILAEELVAQTGSEIPVGELAESIARNQALLAAAPAGAVGWYEQPKEEVA